MALSSEIQTMYNVLRVATCRFTYSGTDSPAASQGLSPDTGKRRLVRQV
jgi:hypothetical protein